MKNQKVAVVGTGYVGLVTGTCLADLGVNVTCVDVDKEKIERLKTSLHRRYVPTVEVRESDLTAQEAYIEQLEREKEEADDKITERKMESYIDKQTDIFNL